MKEILGSIVNLLIEQFLKKNTLWINHPNYIKVNLKSNLVKDVYIRENLIKAIRRYQIFLLESTVDLNFTLENKYRAICRIKTPNSIEDKIKRYNLSPHEYGEIPLFKCLNDLFGARIVLDGNLNFEEICNFLKNKDDFRDRNVQLRCNDASKNGYKATHVYFKKCGDNSAFPWELQIWSAEDEENNIKSHKKYKQEYTKWEKQMVSKKEGKECSSII